MWMVEYMEGGQVFEVRYDSINGTINAATSLSRTGVTRIKVTDLTKTLSVKCCSVSK